MSNCSCNRVNRMTRCGGQRISYQQLRNGCNPCTTNWVVDNGRCLCNTWNPCNNPCNTSWCNGCNANNHTTTSYNCGCNTNNHTTTSANCGCTTTTTTTNHNCNNDSNCDCE